MEWKTELDKRKRTYRAFRAGIDVNKEPTQQSPPSRDVGGVYLPSAYGADIEAEQVFQEELHEIVDQMKVDLVDEQKILEGTLNPEYGKKEWTLPLIEKTMTEDEFRKNELSQAKITEEQWKSALQNGSSITDLTPRLTHDSNNSACFAELFNRNCPITQSDERSTLSSTDSCSGKLDECGTEIDAMNESSECMVPMTSELMLGTPNETRWSPPLRCMESLVPNLPDGM